VCILLLVGLSVVSNPTAGAQAAEDDARVSYADEELLAALQATGMVDDWINAGQVSPEAALVRVQGSAAYELGRQELIAALEKLIDRTAELKARVELVEDIETRTSALEQFIRDLRYDVMSSSEDAFGPSRLINEAHDRLVLGAIVAGLDPATSGEHSATAAEVELVGLGDRIEREVQRLGRRGAASAKTTDAVVLRLSAFGEDFERVRALIEQDRELNREAAREIAPAQDAVRALMPALHQQRLLRPSSVSNLPLVTVDAYVRGAAALDPACPVDWTLLAGIGRVESAHGTLDGSTVQASGRVTTSIYGPLLDGGATEREAEEAAEAEAEAIRVAEEAAAAEAEAEASPEYDAALWGTERDQVSQELARAEESRTPVGVAAEPVEVVEVEPPRFDPAIWGDVPELEDGDDTDEAPVDEETDEDELEFKGNGFAVIEDSDDGVLDGNDRWDRAIGPMQFIPETWSYWATDGNDDGVIDPQNLYDATASAGRFLCHLSRTRGSDPTTFVLGYNSSSTYVATVERYARDYALGNLPIAS